MALWLAKNQTGNDIVALQYALNTLRPRVKPLVTDGIFGDHTENRLRDFQTSVGLKCDGIAGPKTLSELFEVVDLKQTINVSFKVVPPSTTAYGGSVVGSAGGMVGADPLPLLPRRDAPDPGARDAAYAAYRLHHEYIDTWLRQQRKKRPFGPWGSGLRPPGVEVAHPHPEPLSLKLRQGEEVEVKGNEAEPEEHFAEAELATDIEGEATRKHKGEPLETEVSDVTQAQVTVVKYDRFLSLGLGAGGSFPLSPRPGGTDGPHNRAFAQARLQLWPNVNKPWTKGPVGASFEPHLVGSVLVGTFLRIAMQAGLQVRFEVSPRRGNRHDFAWFFAGSVGYVATWEKELGKLRAAAGHGSFWAGQGVAFGLSTGFRFGFF